MGKRRRLLHLRLDGSGTPGSADAAPEQSPLPIRRGPVFWRTYSGAATLRSPPVTGSLSIVSPEAMIAQPRSSIALVKKSPSRRSSPVATQVVPDWQMSAASEIGRPTGSTVSILRPLLSALRTVAWKIEIFDGSHATSTSLSVWYQTIESLPASPAATHGQNTRWPCGAAIVIASDHV